MSAVLPSHAAAAPVRQFTHWTDRIAHLTMLVVALALVAFLALPLLSILLQALQGREGQFVGLSHFIEYARTPSLLTSLWNSLWVSALVTVITLPLAFVFAYALTAVFLFGCSRSFAGLTVTAPAMAELEPAE